MTKKSRKMIPRVFSMRAHSVLLLRQTWADNRRKVIDFSDSLANDQPS